MNLVNANCDSKKPRSKKDLLRDLETWDRTQGRQIGNNISNSTNSISRKDFDGTAWAASHDQDFKKLIAEARRKAQTKKSELQSVPAKTDEDSAVVVEQGLSLLKSSEKS